MNAQQLKNSILQLAVQGKLVPQDPNDEPASALIERIRAKKERLIKEKKIKPDKNPSYIFRGSDNLPYEKVGKNEPVCIADEVPFDIPDSWEWVRIGTIEEINLGFTYRPTYVDDGIFFLSVKDISGGKIDFSNAKKVSKATYDNASYGSKPQKGDILFGRVGTMGKPQIIDTDVPFCIFVSLGFFRDHTNIINKEYICLWMQSQLFDKQVNVKVKGSAQKNLNTGWLKDFLIPLPPLSEQDRIVEKYKEFEPYINAYDKAYEKIEKLNTDFPDLLKKSILQEAVQGKLVPQDPTDEPASILIEKIRQEKEQLIKDKKIKKDKNESYIFRRDNSHYEKIGTEERCIDDEIPFEIPDSWEWCTLASVTEQIHYGYTASAAPVGDAKLARITDIQDNKIMWETVPYCSISKENLPKYKLKNRDILIARTGGTIGKTYIVRNLNENAVFASYLIRAIPLQLVNEEYLKLFMESPLYWEQLKAYSMGTGQPNVNGQSLSKLRLPLPPLNEQQRIVEYYKNILPKIKDLK
ncbi:putative type I restriction-modification system S subunit [Fusobacterium sp. CAG:439]|nr:putative type I restriction-modification system S subunit [Fusobacterium sp. CAG:439]